MQLYTGLKCVYLISLKQKKMKLTFCPVDLPENQEIETIDFADTTLLKEFLFEQEFKEKNGCVMVIWEEIESCYAPVDGVMRGASFQICHSHEIDLNAYLNYLIDQEELENLNVFCFATFEEAFDYAKDYCHGVWPSPDDAVN